MSARRTLAIAAAALLCGVGDVLLVRSSEHFPDPEVWAVFGPLVGWSFVGTGLYAWRRRPESRFGRLMVLAGFAWFLGPLYASDEPLVFTVGIVLSGLWGPVFGHLLLSFPTGRLPTRARRRLVAASYVLIPLAPVPALLVSDADEVINDCLGECPRNVLLISDEPGLSDAALAYGSLVTLVLCLVAVGMLVRQWRAAGAPERRSLVPLFSAGGLMLALIAAYAVTQVDALLWMAFAAFAATPFAFLAGLARADLSGSRGVRILMAALGDMPERADLRESLARALGDPALELAFWMPELDRYVDAEGSPVELPADGRPPPDGDRDPPPGRSRGRHRPRPGPGSGHGARRRRRHGAAPGQPAARCRAACAAGRARRLARSHRPGGRRRAPAPRARPPRRRPVTAGRPRAQPSPRAHGRARRTPTRPRCSTPASTSSG